MPDTELELLYYRPHTVIYSVCQSFTPFKQGSFKICVARETMHKELQNYDFTSFVHELRILLMNCKICVSLKVK